jgi:hypothetical protein
MVATMEQFPDAGSAGEYSGQLLKSFRVIGRAAERRGRGRSAALRLVART